MGTLYIKKSANNMSEKLFMSKRLYHNIRPITRCQDAVVEFLVRTREKNLLETKSKKVVS